ncbi:hypothetical protein [Thalassobellus suaedae]|uniref:DUF2383 domain-containing protein n=1 Tax=Thalassobellus suaedae TaxID=3074124 RepID=A0ABY9Y5W2_9FLAO|nr:hypothetical protein RHP51_14315 [Flavobacteriaceae bacterium HL-DH14]WNH13637.1 hypothetical protein RHP49_05130 [Flavobacteriaceae bacterium HL-DH10]
MGVKRYDKILMKLNDLLLMNHEVEKIFSKIQYDDVDSSLKSFFKEKEIERSEFCTMLQNESKKLETKIDDSIMLNRRNHLTKLNLKKILRYDKDVDLFRQVNNVMQLSIYEYNEFLMEMNLPLSLCKLLIKQRDCIESSLHHITREAEAMRLA